MSEHPRLNHCDTPRKCLADCPDCHDRPGAEKEKVWPISFIKRAEGSPEPGIWETCLCGRTVFKGFLLTPYDKPMMPIPPGFLRVP